MIAFVFIFTLCGLVNGASVLDRFHTWASVLERFHTWADKFKIHFNDEADKMQIYAKWVANDKIIESTNAQNLTYALGHNQFSGMDLTDFKKYLGYSSGKFTENLRGLKNVDESLSEPIASLPSSINWVDLGAVTPVKDQGQCGSCWSFSTTGSLEGAYFVTYGELLSFSEQQLVDCDNWKNGGRDHGCNGGLMDNAFNWIHSNGGLCSESAYPYVSGTTETAGTCTTTCSVNSKSKIQSYVDVTASSDSAMMAALVEQPVSVAIEADQVAFQLYKSGVFTGTCGTNLDHGVLVVGYGEESGSDYYRVKNSWGTSWGLDGYILLGRGSSYNSGAGQCGVLLEASYPLLV